MTEYFSYEHFYVIYCKFWELDKDHDLFIDRADLARHNDHGVSFDSCDLQLNYREWCLNKLSAIYPDVCIYRYIFVCGFVSMWGWMWRLGERESCWIKKMFTKMNWKYFTHADFVALLSGCLLSDTPACGDHKRIRKLLNPLFWK